MIQWTIRGRGPSDSRGSQHVSDGTSKLDYIASGKRYCESIIEQYNCPRLVVAVHGMLRSDLIPAANRYITILQCIDGS